jgi:hypothetical protein
MAANRMCRAYPRLVPLESPDVKKELRPFHDIAACDVCGRTILKGERTEAFLAPGGARHSVCELCFVRAEHEGWIRESANDQLPSRSARPQERRSLLGRLRRRPPAAPDGDELEEYAPPPAMADPMDPDGLPGAGNGEPAAVPASVPLRRERPQHPRHVRGVPTTAEVKVERALELFNASESQRTMAGLTRSLGAPWVTALPDPDAPSTVTVLIAWELSWYRYRVDLGDAAEPVVMQGKGDELSDIDAGLREWNAELDADGRVVIGVDAE